MTNQEAIASLRTLCHTCELFPKCVHEKPECFQAIELAISALEAQEVKNSNQEVKNSSDLINRQAAIDAFCERCKLKGKDDLCPDPCTEVRTLYYVPSAQPEWNNHTVACMLADLFNDTCACNYNGIDEWLPFKCELLDACPHPAGVACWEQFLKYREGNNGRLN